MVLENRYGLVGNGRVRTLLLLGGYVLDNDDERGSHFVRDPETFLREQGFHYHFRDASWIAYEKNKGFQQREGVTIYFSPEIIDGRRRVEIRGIEQHVLNEKWHLGLKIE